jgi:hypothetical protein
MHAPPAWKYFGVFMYACLQGLSNIVSLPLSFLFSRLPLRLTLVQRLCHWLGLAEFLVEKYCNYCNQ